MGADDRALYDAFPDPAPELAAVDGAQLDRIDESLHWMRAWHRHRRVFRHAETLQILDAGCGTGLSTLGLAKLNRGSRVVGIDVSPRSLDVARRRAAAAGPELAAVVSFVEHDLTEPLPRRMGPFDFVAARRVLRGPDDASAVLATLTRAMAHDGLLLTTFATAAARAPAAPLLRAVDAIVEDRGKILERAQVGLALLAGLRADHPIRMHDAALRGGAAPSVVRFVANYLRDESPGWTLEAAVDSLGEAGLTFLYAAERGGWRPDAVFGPAVPARLRQQVDALDDHAQARLRDALDPTLHRRTYTLYACLLEFEPHVPTWPAVRDPRAVAALRPHATGLHAPVGGDVDSTAAARGRVAYRASNGTPGELEARAHRGLALADGTKTVGEIEASVEDGGGGGSIEAVRARWLNLADHGFVVLEPPDLRQKVDCARLGAVRDRLGCGCPRAWIRDCELHEVCTIAAVSADDPRARDVAAALDRMVGRSTAVACARCPDYRPDV